MKFMDWIGQHSVRVGFDHRGAGLSALDIQADSTGVSLTPDKTLPLVTSTAAGVLSPDDKNRLDGLQNTLVSTDALTFQSRAQLTVTAVTDAQALHLRTTGYFTPADGGGALYKRAASEPVHDFKVQSADGTWWEGTPEGGLIDIRQLGAVADYDGTTGTDNATSINQAVYAASLIDGARGAFVPEGRFLANGIYMPMGTMICGTGDGSRLEFNNPNVNLITIVDGVTVKDLHLVGDNLGTGSGIWLSNAVFGNSVTHIRVENCHIENIGNATTAGSSGIAFLGSSHYLFVLNNFIEGGEGQGVAADINFYNNDIGDVVCTGNQCLSTNRQGIACQFGGVQRGRRIIANNICKNHVDHGISIGYADASSDRIDTVCSNNVCYNNGGTGIYFASGVAGGGTVVISSNVISHCAGWSTNNGQSLNGGIVVSGDDPILITDNTVHKAGIEPDGTVGAVGIQGGIHGIGKRITIDGNDISQCSGPGLAADSNSQEIIWTNNRVYNCSSDSGADQGGGYVELTSGFERILIDGNTFDQSSQDVHCLNLANFGSHGRKNVKITNNRFIGADGTATNAGIRCVFAFEGQVSGNKFITCARGLDMGGDDSSDYFDGERVQWTDNYFQDCSVGVRYFISTSSGSPVFSQNNAFRNCTNDFLSSDPTNGTHYMAKAIAGDGGPREFWAAAAPTVGMYRVGDMAWNAAPAVGAPTYWVCTSAGAPGVWQAGPNL